MSKSGEILRIGHGDYSFLCIHCGFNFSDINEILNHIDYHYDMLDSKVSALDGKFDFQDSTCEDAKENYTNPTVEPLFVADVFHHERIEVEFKSEAAENSREAKSDLEEVQLDVKIFEDAKSVPKIHHKNATTTSNKQNTKIQSEKKNATTTSKKRSTKKQKEEEKNDIPEKNSCPICELNFDNLTDYHSHLRDTHRMYKKVFQCYICGSFCRTVNLLKRHMNGEAHSKTNCYQCESKPAIQNELDPRPHKCFFCKSWFDNHLRFRKHFKDVHQQDVEKFFSKKTNCNEYSCYICKKDFLYKYYLRNHMIIHDEIKEYVCDVCGQCYRTKAILKRHSNVHEGKIYECGECGKKFPYYARLRIHLYSHRTELNYKCRVCSKAFKVQKYLARHMKMHQDEKAYACKYCGKRFTFSTGRRAHEISQHNAI